MKNKALSSVIFALALIPAAHASDLKECQAKIASMLANVKPTTTKGPAGNAAAEQYRMSADQSCGVEYLADTAQLTVTRFSAGELKKFETILLNEAELTTGGRVRATLTCEIDGDSVIYQTRLPIFSDGVRTPFQKKTLKVSLEDKTVWVQLESRLSLLASKINCSMEF
jgi:hypothetical protein